jgi:glycosyltransferase involved in cell wall biosynthesis
MDAPSHYQSAFYKALDERSDVDLHVCYLQEVSQTRAAQGWSNKHAYEPYESCAAALSSPEERLALVPEWEERIHIVSSHIYEALIDFFCAHGTRWCHWSEASGIRLAELVGYRMGLFRMLNPLMLKSKRKDSFCMRKHALAVFGQGSMAARAFRIMGVPADKIHDLYYSPAPLPAMEPSSSVVEFAKGRKVFLSVGALCIRKGIDLLLEAFAKLKTDDWCLVLCGLDRESGAYRKLAEKLGVQDRVLFLGAYPIDRISEVYTASDVFILSSRFDGWGAVLNEAASLGLPLIGTDLCGASWHVIREAKNGHRIKAGSVMALQKAMSYYVDHPASIEKYGTASKEIYFNEFTPERNAERLVGSLTVAGGAGRE